MRRTRKIIPGRLRPCHTQYDGYSPPLAITKYYRVALLWPRLCMLESRELLGCHVELLGCPVWVEIWPIMACCVVEVALF